MERREFVTAAVAALVLPRVARAAVRGGPHPEPRAGITAAKVATDVQLAEKPDAKPVFALAREIPQVLDGIRCQCGCTDGKAYYSLLSCFEAPDMMAADCQVCQAQARLAHRLHTAGKTLPQVRAGIDARFG